MRSPILIKTLVLILVTTVSTNILLGQSDRELPRRMTEANKAYQEERFPEALYIYEQLIDDGWVSVALYYNLANTYYRSGQLAKARLYYERALLLAPSDRMVKQARSVLLEDLEDQFEVGQGFFLLSWGDQVMKWFSASVWAFLTFLAGLGMTSLGVLLWRYPDWRKRWRSWTALVVLTTLFGLFLHFTFAHHAWKYKSDRAILSEPEIALRVAADDRAEEMFAIHEGTEVKMLDRIGDWTKVRLVNFREGWLPTASLLPLVPAKNKKPSSEEKSNEGQ